MRKRLRIVLALKAIDPIAAAKAGVK